MAEHDDEGFLSAREAARLLGVKLPSLYAYASRGWLRSHPTPGSRRRRYLRSEVARLKAQHDARSGHAPVAAAALRWGEPVLDTRITCITPRGPAVHGHLLVELAARGVTFEAVAELLWSGTLPGGVPRWRAQTPPVRVRRALETLLPVGTPALRALALVVAALPDGGAGGEGARALVGQFLWALERVGGVPHAVEGSVAGRVLWALGGRPSRAAERAVGLALVLSADHELNASTFAARVAASTGADLSACVAAALAAFSGVRHGTASLQVEAVLERVRRPEDAAGWVRAEHAAGRALPGFGHPLYPEGDPRTPPLLAAAASLAPRRRGVRVLQAVVAAARPAREYPTLDLGLVALAEALGLVPGAAQVLFAVGRVAGWVAHALEQREAPFLLRPRARYVGPVVGDGVARVDLGDSLTLSLSQGERGR